MRRAISISGEKPVAGLWLRAWRGGKIEQVASDRFKIDDRWYLSISGSKAARRQSDGQWELLVPVVFEGEKATIELTYDW